MAVIAVTGRKGGIGKNSLSANFAAEFVALGHRVAVSAGLAQVGHRLAGWITTRVGAWWTPVPAHVIIGTLRTDRLAVAIWAQVVRERTPPPLQTFLARLSFRDPYCPHCSLPLDPLVGDLPHEGTHIGYQCRPCDTQIRWPPADVRKQIAREVRRHYADYWQTYHDAIHLRETARR